MTLFPIKDDFVLRTLANVPGIWGKLDYVSDLRENGKYVHWGLARVYGEEATQLALREVHRELFLQVLRTRVRQLATDVVCSAAGKQEEVGVFLESLVEKSSALVPPDIGGGSVVHFHATLAALSRLPIQREVPSGAGATRNGTNADTISQRPQVIVEKSPSR